MSSDTQPKAAPKEGSASTLATLRPVIVLVTICLVAGVLLGVVHSVTAPVADAVAQERAEQTYRSLVPDAAAFSPMDCDVDGVTALLAAQDGGGQTIAYVVVAQSKGYSDQVPIAVAFDLSGNVSAIAAMSNSETPGLGTRVAEDSFIGQFRGLGTDEVTTDDIDTITGATISSKAVIAAFNHAAQAMREVQNG